MTWKLDNSRSIYIQLIEQISLRIMTGTYASGSRLPSVRELAEDAGVNPNTMQRALSELERSGLVYSQRTSGRFVTDDTERIYQMKINTARKAARDFMAQMKSLGLTKEEITQLLQDTEEHPAAPDAADSKKEVI